MSDQLARLPHLLTAHLQLSLIALLLGAAISVPLGIWATGRPRVERLALAVASVIQTIPSLALLAIMVPTLAALGALTGVEVRSIGYLPALIGLTLYSMLPMLRNTVTGIAGVDPALVEAARGVGMTDGQVLRLVQLPLALPVLVAGVRTATVWVVGIATLSTPVGAPSLGNYIFSGLQTRNFASVLVGCIAAAGLALLLDSLIHVLEIGIQRRRRALVLSAAGLLVGLYAFTAVTLVGANTGGTTRPVAIGAKTFTEQYILSAVLAERIRRDTDTTPRIVGSLGSTVAFDALRTGDLDLYVDYTGTLWATIMHRTDVLPRAQILADVTAHLAREHDVTVVAPLGFENAYALAMRRAHAEALGVRTISDLARNASRLEIAGDYEFFARPEWTALVDRYGLAFAGRRSMDSSLMYQAVAESQVDVISAFSTDGRIVAFDLTVLEDDRRAMPPYDAIVLAGARLARDAPDVLAAVQRLSGAIDASQMRRLNAAVDRDGRQPAAVARAWLDAREGR